MKINRADRYRLATVAVVAVAASGAAWALAPDFPATLFSHQEIHGPIAAQPAVWDGGHSVADVVAKVEPAVVTITVDEEAQPASFQGIPGGSDGPFGDFFRQFMGNGQVQQVPSQPTQALGSGFLVDGSGDILTNNHVVDGGTRFTVEFSDKSIAQATLVGTDPQTDLALIHVDRVPDAAPLGFANSDTLRVGDPVIAIGDPYGVGQTVTAGVVSARGRSLGNSSYVDYIQTDAPINQGNSGGPLLDYAGRVVGVNSAIFSPSGGNVGIGFAIPSNTAHEVIEALKSKGRVTRAWLGAAIQDVTPQIAAAAGLDKAEGAIVAQVDPSGPAAGHLRPGDIVLDFAGKPVREARDLSMAASHAAIGSDASLTIVRQGMKHTISVRMGRLQGGSSRQADQSAGGDKSSPRLGVTVVPLDGDARLQLGVPADETGMVVTDVDPDGAGGRAGLRPGDLIEQVGGAPVTDRTSLAHALGSVHNNTALLLVERDGQRRFLAVPLG